MEAESKKKAKYMEGYLELKEASKWVNYWVVIRGCQLFFYKNPDTHINENILFHLDIGANSNFVSGKSRQGKFEFEVKIERNKKYLLRANTEADRLQWVYTLGLAAQGKPPPTSFVSDPDPGDSSNNSKTSLTRTASNQYSEVPTFHNSPNVAGVTDEEMQKNMMSLKKHNSFSSYCKQFMGRKDKHNNKSVDSEESSGPESVQIEAQAEADYDPFPEHKPLWYFGKLTRENSEKILQDHLPGSYLVRDSETVNKPGAYTISLKHREKFRHHKVETLPDGNLVIKTFEDKVFPNLEALMDYFTKSQEREIRMAPVYCKDQVDNDGNAVEPVGFEPNGLCPPVPGFEDRPSRPHSCSVPSGASRKPSYENVPDKQKARPSLKSRITSPDLYKNLGYENLPNKDKRPVTNRPQQPDPTPEGYESMNAKGATAPAPALPPRRAPKCSGYENLPSKGAQPLPSREPPCEGYVNIPARPDVCTSNGPPPLPPKAPPQGLQGYENLPTKNESSLRTRSPYQNIGANGRPHYSQESMVPSSSARRQPAPFRRSATVPAHIMQNTLEKGAY